MGYSIRVKICGVTTAEDAALVAQAGADAIGINFYPRSPRYVEPVRAADVLGGLPAFVEAVAVFAGETAPRMVARCQPLSRIRSIQVHGDWPEPGAVAPFPLILAVAVGSAEHLAEVTAYLAKCRCANRLPAAVLVDARVPGQFGGSGQTAPWHLLADFKPGVPLILAGGLTPDNVAEAVRRVRPDGVDVAGGVERAPGRKDADKMRRFVEAAREAAARLC
jgi:phosphoribosylanthranilate isomerase